MKKLTLFFIFTTSILLGNAQLISSGAEWKYLDDGSDQGTAWTAVSFNDSSWATGNAQFGYGDGDETTVISYGTSSSNKHITYYFRKALNIQDPDQENGLKIRLLRDDGAVVYINGTEVLRSNMPSGTITYTTFAAHTVGGDDEDIFFEYIIPSDVLVQGNNMVAVELHQRSRTSSDCSFDMALEFAHYELSAFRKEPYLLYSGNNTQMTVIWQLNETGNCELKWGTDTTYSSGTLTTTEYGSDHQHKATLDNLQPGTHYYYQVTYDNTAKTGHFFAGIPATQTAFSFYAYGDTRSQPSEHDAVAEQILNSIANDPDSQTFIVNSGDLVANGDDELDWDNQFFSSAYTNIRQMMAEMPYLAAVGNHEGAGALFEKYFPYPMFQNSRYYYSFDYGNAHFTVIDQFTDYSQGSTQYTWIENDLASSNKTWKFILLHKPGWSAGGHSNSTTVQNDIQPLCETYNVQFVINGHNHYYSRAVVNDVQHITTGGGGAPLYNPNTSMPNIVIADKSYHFCKFDIDGENIECSVIRSDGSLVESFQLSATNSIEQTYMPDIKFYKLSNGVMVENFENKKIKLEIYNDMGQQIDSKVLQKGNNRFSNIKTGIYFFRIISSDGKMAVKKLLINR